MTVGLQDNTAEQIAGRDIYNITSSNDDELDTRPLVPAQRKSLNSLISDIENYGELTAPELWLKLHATLGVCSINEITVSQFPIADKFLTDEFEAAKEKASCKMLIHLILCEINGKDELKDKMNHYSKRQFCTSDLKRLNKMQLQNVLNYVEELSNLEKLNNQNLYNQTITLFRTQIKPTLAIFAVGFILGAIIF
ncbi:hypothetical protein J3U08_06615 [Gilliamella sp. B2894]|uniref:hypothetical protein n=1 Tax=unclassified Gilliamella TaxID=2685620 RepID=UPI00226A3E71|nr:MULTISPECIES: hypothetical protein [unclassified Gilliamella]MCX8656458.1 hypothetical protein [Gilliamella sp. B2894]MCX8692987.1 hypothetical protein [Gilliamella sp. B2881]MCX8696228.1 hypothetical protein [Gilliamella sp. B2828]